MAESRKVKKEDPQEDPRDAALRALRAEVALLEGAREDKNELLRFYANQNDVYFNFIKERMEAAARRDRELDAAQRHAWAVRLGDAAPRGVPNEF